jgi:hypothetical protein
LHKEYVFCTFHLFQGWKILDGPVNFFPGKEQKMIVTTLSSLSISPPSPPPPFTPICPSKEAVKKYL